MEGKHLQAARVISPWPRNGHALLPRGALTISGPRELLVTGRLPCALEPDGAPARDTIHRAADPLVRLDRIPSLPLNVETTATSDEAVVWGGAIAGEGMSPSAAVDRFLVESVARLWPLLPGGELEGLPVVFTQSREPPYVEEWLRAFGVRVVELPDEGAVRFTRMYVPEPAWQRLAWVAPEIRDIHLHARNGMEVRPVACGELAWIRHAGRRGAPHGEDALESLLDGRATVVDPAGMTLGEQVAAFEGCDTVAGVANRAFRTLLLAKDPPDCVYLCPPWVNGMLVAQHWLLESRVSFVRALDPPGWEHRRDDVPFPSGYRLSIADATDALFTAAPAHSRFDGKTRSLKRGRLKLTGPRELVVQRSLLGAFEADGRVAQDTLRAADTPASYESVPEVRGGAEPVADYDEEVVWGGYVSAYYGHFLVESVARLWPLLPGGELEGLPVVFTQTGEQPYVDEWLGAFGARVVELPDEGAVRFTRMYVPEPAWRIDAWIAPEIRDIHLHARRGMDVPRIARDDLLWLSRAQLWRSKPAAVSRLSRTGGRRVRAAYDELLLEWLLRDHITPISPETMTLADQLGALEASNGVAGVVGSAFHTLLATETTPTCLYLCPPWQKEAFVAQHRLLPGEAEFALGLEVAEWSRRARREGIGFPLGYRLLVPEILRALGSSLIPDILADDRIAACTATGRGGAGNGAADLESAVARVLREPLSADARVRLGITFMSEGLDDCALEQFTMLTDLYGDATEAPRRAIELLARMDAQPG